MAVMKVLPYPNPFLRQRAQDVQNFDASLRQLVADMEETMDAEDGIGLAATQVGVDLRLLILAPYAFEGEEGIGKPNLVVINPEIVWKAMKPRLRMKAAYPFRVSSFPSKDRSRFAFKR